MILCLSVLMMQVVFAGGQAITQQKRGLEFEKTVHDYGKIKRKSDGTCKFKLKNVDTVPVVISNVKASCGCTTPVWPKGPIAPGDSAEVEVGYNTKFIGPFTKTILVSTSASQSILLTIKGEVLKK